ELRSNIRERGNQAIAKLEALKAELGGLVTKVQGIGLLFSCELSPEFKGYGAGRSEEHTSELQSREKLVCRLLLEKKKINHSIVGELDIPLSVWMRRTALMTSGVHKIAATTRSSSCGHTSAPPRLTRTSGTIEDVA